VTEGVELFSGYNSGERWCISTRSAPPNHPSASTSPEASVSVSRSCFHCGSTFTVKHPSDPQKYCNHACYVEGMRIPLAERFWRHVNKDGPIPEQRPELGPCWSWTGTIMEIGYGMLGFERKHLLAHRISYQLNVGEIPSELELDHLCRNRGCVNPTHLEAVTRLTNFLRGDHPSAVAFRVGSCKNGHERTAENTIVRPDGRRECRVCRDATKRRWDFEHGLRREL
jgi:hypothetical protein